MKFTVLSFLVLAGLAIPSAPADELDTLLENEMRRQKIPGMSIAVIRNGTVEREAGYGSANVELQVAASPDTIYQSGSVGKQFTAALVMLLAGDGLLAVDDPVSRHLPGTPPEWEKITIRHLLNHTSGLGDPYGVLDLRKDYSDEELLAVEAGIPLLFEPGTAWSYSNMGYHVLGFVCNRVGRKFYGHQLRQRIFLPAGMTTAAIISERAIVPNRADGYELTPFTSRLQNQSWVAPRLNTTADGSIYLTVRDLSRWMIALDGETPLNGDLKQAIWEPAILSDGKTVPYGFGWSLEPHGRRRAVSHGGAWQGFTSHVLRLPDDRLSVVVLTNLAGADPGRIAAMIADHCLEPAGTSR